MLGRHSQTLAQPKIVTSDRSMFRRRSGFWSRVSTPCLDSVAMLVRAARFAAVLGALGVLAAGCGGSSSNGVANLGTVTTRPSPAAQSALADALRCASCMRRAAISSGMP